eukprot:Em0010g252a
MIFFLGDFNTCVYLSLMRTHTCTVRICHGQVEDTFSCYDSDDSCVGRRAQYAYLDSELGAAVRRCCLSLGGLSYTSSESSESCSQCTVYGFLKTSNPDAQHVTSITYLEEDSAAMSLSFGIIRGSPSGLRAFTFTTTDITTVPKDYVLPKQQFLVADKTAKSIGLRVTNDQVALEGTEQFRIHPVSSLGQDEFAQDIVVSIVDNNVVFVQFSESEYSVLEGRSPAIVTVARKGAIARPLELSIIPLAFQQVPVLFDALPEAEGLVPAEFSLLGKKDFDGSPRSVTFLPSDIAAWSLNVSIPVFDDKTNSADEGFVVELELVGQDTIHGVDTMGQNITIVRIINDDPLFVGFVDTNIAIREGENTRVCLRVLDPPPTIIISEAFKLQINLQTTSLLHTVAPTNIISDSFNNTSREWCFIASTNDNNMYEKAESVIYTASVLNQAATRLAGFEAGIGSDLVVVSPSSLTLTIVNINALFAGFVNTSIMAREGDNTRICLRVFNPPPAVIISEAFRLQINLQATSLLHTVAPTIIISDSFNNTSREWCFIASTNDNNVYEKAESVIYTASVLNQTATRLAGFEAGVGSDLVVVSPSSLTLTIVNVDAVHIGFAQQEYNVLETRGYAALSVLLLSGNINDAVTLRLRTIENSALAGINYIARDINLAFNGSTASVSIQLLVTTACGTTRCFFAQLSLADQVPLVTIAPNTAKICITKASCSIWISDQVSDDPLFIVHPAPTSTSTSTNAPQPPPPALCYEILGKPNFIFNMVSTHCTSVNALYSSLDGQRNVISTLGLLAVDNSGVCVRVEVGAGDCVPTVGRARLSSQYNQNGVSVTWSKGLVNIGVPDCSHGNMVVSVSCNVIGSRAILGINVMRQLDHHPGSHGLLGQFWDATVAIRPYTGRVPVEFANDSLYILDVSGTGGANRQFLGSKFERTWDLSETTCYYCGNIQGGRSHIVTAYDDAVIEGTFMDYVTEGIFSPSFKFSRFDLNQCSGVFV